MEHYRFPIGLINLVTDQNFCLKKKKRSEIAVLVVKDLPRELADACSGALARVGENWGTGREVGSGRGGREEEELISIFRACENCSILEQLQLLSWKYHKPSL